MQYRCNIAEDNIKPNKEISKVCVRGVTNFSVTLTEKKKNECLLNSVQSTEIYGAQLEKIVVCSHSNKGAPEPHMVERRGSSFFLAFATLPASAVSSSLPT